MTESDFKISKLNNGRVSDAEEEEEEDEESSEGEEECDDQATLAVAFDKKVRPYIDLVDDLRRHGLEKDIALPSAVVIGDQSSGKSSILEAISGVKLPRGSGIVTRCPLELQMKKVLAHGGRWSARLRYQTRSGGEQTIDVSDPDEVEELIREAQNQIAGKNKGISDSLITLRIESSSCPDVTLIDLPGIARTPVGDQPVDISLQIKRLLTRYIGQQNTIILCVIPSNVDIATNEALSMAKDVDPDGSRTLGVLTKPDLVDRGSEMDVLAILNNQRFYLRKGYNIVKCRGQIDIDQNIDLKTAIQQEDDFFKHHQYFCDVDTEVRGTRNLALKLTNTLVDHIRGTLPKLREEVREKYDVVRKKLRDFGEGPPTEEGQKRLFLMKVVDKFMKRVRMAFVNGDRVPGHAIPNPAAHRINRGEEYNTCYFWRNRFANLKSKFMTTTDRHFKHDELSVGKIEEKMNRYRGRELPCFLNIDLFEKLVQEHVVRYKEDMEECCTKLSVDVTAMINHFLDDELGHLPAVKGRFRGLSEETREECREKAMENLEFEMEKEMLVFTQDDTFFRELRALAAKLQQELKNQQQRNQQSNPRSEGNPEEVDFFSFVVSKEKDNRKNAEVMQRLLQVYLKVANRRILDNVPMILRCKQHLNFVEKLHERLQSLCSGEEVMALVNEEPDIERRRRETQESADRLSHAMKKLNNIA